MAKMILVLVVLLVGGLVLWKTLSSSPPKVPQLDLEEWWGPKQNVGKVDATLKPFKVQFTEQMIKDLRARLSNRRPLTPPLEGISLEYGMNTEQLQEFLNYWAKDYPFAAREAFFNKFPQFKTNIQGLDMHFIRVKPEVKPGVSVIPLILIHGWPGSFREFYEAIPLLTTPRAGHDFVFEVVVPSLPGYGFSDPSVRPGLGAAQIGVVMRNLMQRLGHKKYYVQGGDWGAAVGTAMSTLFPDEVLGFHTNFPMTQSSRGMIKYLIGSLMPSLFVEEKLISRLYPVSSFFSYILEEFGYMHLQATKPDSVGVALTDSPAGLAAYILEKFATWTVRGAKEMPSQLKRESLIDNLMVYWASNSITTSMRLYAESFTSKNRALKLDNIPTPVPTWGLQAKNELSYQPAAILRTKYVNLIDTTVLDVGGHFMAFELPEVLVSDVFKAVGEFRKWHAQNKPEKTDL